MPYTATINKVSLVLNAVTDVRQYDGTTASSGQVQAVGLVTGDSVSATQSFDGKNAGAHSLSVDGGYTVTDGNDGGNYIVTIGNTARGSGLPYPTNRIVSSVLRFLGR